jgi:hypothetical protein
MTLEIGIDIGDVDLVVCLSPPSGISSFLQRIGRGCRRREGVTRVMCVARDRSDELIYEAMLKASRVSIPEGPIAPFRRSVLFQQILAYLRQVDGNRRSLDQLDRALTHQAVPLLDRPMLESVLRDMRNSGFLVVENGLYTPSSAGRDFIESNQIYANIGSPRQGLEFVNAETGESISVATDFGPNGDGWVKIGGRSYKVVSTEGGKATVRPEGDSAATPMYATSAFHFAYDVGAALASYFAIPQGRLLALQAGEGLFVMTWLGKLTNTLLAKAAEQDRVRAKGRCFSLELLDVDASTALESVRKWIRRTTSTALMADIPVEQLVDVGPHFRHLSAEEQKRSKQDWLDASFLAHWDNSIHEVELIVPQDPRYADLMNVATVR